MVQFSCGSGMKSLQVHLKANNGKQIVAEVIICNLQVFASILLIPFVLAVHLPISITLLR